MLPLPRPYPRSYVLTHVEVEEVIIDNVKRDAQFFQARYVQAAVAGEVRVVGPEDALVDLGGGEVRVNALKI